MTQEEKARAYDEALERARKILDEILDNELLGFPDQIREIFPQLRESEDERMVRAIEHILYENYSDAAIIEGVEIAEIATWLEKQKEQKPAEWNEEDEEALDMCLDVIPKKWKTKSGILLTKWLKDNIHPQSKQEWNEEDEEIWFTLITFFKGYLQKYPPLCKAEGTQANRILNWLNTRVKSFRLHHCYKPTEDQMKALQNAVALTACDKELVRLYNQLKKL